jgi:SAM-dependent methyltransferase/DNA repair exonuclease SbcCD ATPase subunit
MDSRYARRLPPYVYLQDLIRDRRVLELGTGEGHAAHFLLQAGARSVTGVDRTARAIDGARVRYRVADLDFRVTDYATLQLPDGGFDVVCVPAAAELIRRHGVLEEVKRVLAPGGHVIVSAPSGDRPDARGGVSYHELQDRLAALFGPVRMLGASPFVGFSLVEFGEEAADVLEVDLDTQLAQWGGAGEPVITDYVAVAGGRGGDGVPRGFTVVQLPVALGLQAASDAAGVTVADDVVRPAPTPRPEGGGSLRDENAELRRRLARAIDECASIGAELQVQRQRARDADNELGQVAAQSTREIERARAEATVQAARVVELEAHLATLRRENLGLRADLDTHTAMEALGMQRPPVVAVSTPAPGEEVVRLERLLAEAQRQAARSQDEAARTQIEVKDLTWRLAELETELHRSAAPREGEAVDPMLLLRDAALHHEQVVAELRAIVDERDAYVEELRDELERATAQVDELRRVASAASARATGIDAELREVRGRMARAEGEVLKLRRQAPPVVSAPAAVPTPAPLPPPPLPAVDPGVLARVAELEKALAERSDAAEKANARWKQAEQKSDELWRKVGEMQRELEQNREAGVETARAQRQAAQIALTRAVDEASKRLVSCQDSLKRTERERNELEKKCNELKTRLEGAWRDRDEALRAAADESEAVRAERDATVGKVRGELELMHAAAARRKLTEQALLARVEELEARLAELEGGLREEEVRLGELEDNLRVVHQHAALVPDSSQLERELNQHEAHERATEEALEGREHKLRRLSAELGQRDAELALLHGRVAAAERQVGEVIAAVRRTREQMVGRSAVEIAALLDRLAAEAAESRS